MCWAVKCVLCVLVISRLLHQLHSPRLCCNAVFPLRVRTPHSLFVPISAHGFSRTNSMLIRHSTTWLTLFNRHWTSSRVTVGWDGLLRSLVQLTENTQNREVVVGIHWLIKWLFWGFCCQILRVLVNVFECEFKSTDWWRKRLTCDVQQCFSHGHT